MNNFSKCIVCGKEIGPYGFPALTHKCNAHATDEEIKAAMDGVTKRFDDISNRITINVKNVEK